MITAVAFCPHPPMLVPRLAAGASSDLALLRSACDAAVHAVLNSGVDEMLVIGTGAAARLWSAGSSGGFGGYGLDLTVRLGGTAPDGPSAGRATGDGTPPDRLTGGTRTGRHPADEVSADRTPTGPTAGAPAPGVSTSAGATPGTAGWGTSTPTGSTAGGPVPDGRGTPATGAGVPITDLSLLVGAWLLERADHPPYRVTGLTVPADRPTGECAALGRRLADRSTGRRVGVLVMGDVAARRAIRAPGAPDPEADAFDAAALSALRSGDPAALLDLDAATATQVVAACRAPWQVTAGMLAGRRCAAQVGYADGPHEVTYLAGTWLTARRAG